MTKSKKPAGRPRSNVSPGADYAQWLMLVPKDLRGEVAEFIRKHPLDTLEDLAEFNKVIMAAIMEGRITPIIASELRAWHELSFSIIAAKNSMNGSPENAYTDVITALVQVKRETKKIEPSYFEASDLTDLREPVKIAAGEGE
jgi:hypothetical protein